MILAPEDEGGMESRKRIGATGSLALAALVFAAPAALAHPHVTVTVRTIVTLNAAGEIAALRHAWTFDEPFSAYSTMGLDKNKDGKLDREELAELAKINVESLHEYGFFSFLKKGKSAAAYGDVRDYHLDHDGKALTLHFTLPVAKNAPPIRDAKLEVYDPSYFVAFEFAAEKPVIVEGGALACTAQVTPPSASVTARLSQLGESFFQSMQPNAGTAEWAIPVRFACR
jgi:ABC-type uncharacterized transport system substrate-binding protein